jgi:hypothetical protein
MASKLTAICSLADSQSQERLNPPKMPSVNRLQNGWRDEAGDLAANALP